MASSKEVADSSTSLVSPLVQVEKGELKPKVLSIYEQLFQPNSSGELIKSQDYWTEFFLLRCHQPALFHSLESLSAEQTIAAKSITRDLFQNAIKFLRTNDKESNHENTLRILSIFLQSIFAKPFVSYSSDLINVLAGLDKIDSVFKGLVDALDGVIRNGNSLAVRVSAIRTTTVAAGGTYNTSLATYFTHNNNKDMFGSIMAFINSSGAELYIGDAFSLLGILSGFDKMESPHNPYQTRLADFIDDDSMKRIVQASGHVWKICLDQYQSSTATATPPPQSSSSNPSPSSSTPSLGSTLAYWIGLRPPQNTNDSDSIDNDSNTVSLSSPQVDAEDDKFPPHQTISIVLGLYEFINVNKIFARVFIQSKAPETQQKDLTSSSTEPPFVQFINLSSWLFQNQHKTNRSRMYSRLFLIIYRLLVEESGSVLVEDDNKTTALAICQSRNPPLPKYGVKHSRSLMEGVLDSLQTCIRYNMKAKSMDYEMYALALTNVFQILVHLRTNKVRLTYHWQELWKSLISLVKFLSSHPNSDPNLDEASRLICLIFACCLIHGDDTILSDDQQYHDLIYKLIASADDIKKIIGDTALPSGNVITAAIDHYNSLLEKQTSNKKFSLITANQVSQAIKNGYQSISLQQYATTSNKDEESKKITSLLLHEGLPKYKESNERLFFKNLTRQVIHDVHQLYI